MSDSGTRGPSFGEIRERAEEILAKSELRRRPYQALAPEQVMALDVLALLDVIEAAQDISPHLRPEFD